MIDIGARLPKCHGMSNCVPDGAEAEQAMRVMEELFARFPSHPIWGGPARLGGPVAHIARFCFNPAMS